MTFTPELPANREAFERLDEDGTLAAVGASRRRAQAAEVDVLLLAARWAELHDRLSGSRRTHALPGTERMVDLGGDGTPQVAEFAPSELKGVLGLSDEAAAALITDALDLRHRLPLTWARALDGDVAPWIARRIAQETRALSADAAAVVDARVSRWSDRLTWSRLREVVRAAVIAADPDQAQREADAAASAQFAQSAALVTWVAG